MVRVGGGWVALDEFLVKNDPCRGESIRIKLGRVRVSAIAILSNQNIHVSKPQKKATISIA